MAVIGSLEVAMPEGFPSLRWSAEPKRRNIVMVAGFSRHRVLSCKTSSV